MSDNFDLIVIGGGPGGYAGAIRASQLGLRTALIEKRDTPGGTCMNVGCIPAKTLLDSTEKYELIKNEASEYGILTGDVSFDLQKMMARKNGVVQELTDGLNFLFKKNKITTFNGVGSFKSAAPGEIIIEISGSEPKTIVGKNVIIATGSEVMELPGITIDRKQVIGSDEALSLSSVPEKLLVIGAGVIGLELGSVWRRLGSEVTIIDILPALLPTLDKRLGALAKRQFEKQGLKFHLDTRVEEVQTTPNGVILTLQNKKGETLNLEGNQLLLAVGRRPYTEGLNLEAIGLKLNERGQIPVDPSKLATTVPGVYAIGDVIEGAMLAHRAEEEGVMVAEQLAGIPAHINYKTLPYVVYTKPEIAWVGRSSADLTAEGIEHRVGRFNFRANGRARAMNEIEGEINIIADKETDRLLGVFIIGPHASELLGEAVLAMEFGASSEDVARTFHAHPTLSETIKEAALAVDGRAIHS